jgi:hypothetical protein
MLRLDWIQRVDATWIAGVKRFDRLVGGANSRQQPIGKKKWEFVG